MAGTSYEQGQMLSLVFGTLCLIVPFRVSAGTLAFGRVYLLRITPSSRHFPGTVSTNE